MVKGLLIAVAVALALGFCLVSLAGHGPPGDLSAAFSVAPLDSPALDAAAPSVVSVAPVALERSTVASLALAVASPHVYPGNLPAHEQSRFAGKESEPRSRDVRG